MSEFQAALGEKKQRKSFNAPNRRLECDISVESATNTMTCDWSMQN
jgi:hypothetical protein